MEKQYADFKKVARAHPAHFGMMMTHDWHGDPRRILFVLARYKFVAKMFSGMDRVLEVGCASGFGLRLVQQEVKHLVAVDIEIEFVKEARKNADPSWPFICFRHDIVKNPLAWAHQFDGAYALDVLEHIPLKDEHMFLSNLKASVHDHGVCIIGSPSLESQEYASDDSRAGHVNCKTHDALKDTMRRYFQNVFIFSMNDETIHTGYHKMAHYRLALCCGKK